MSYKQLVYKKSQPNDRYALLAVCSRASGYSRKCRACARQFPDYLEAQTHWCPWEEVWRARTGNVRPSNPRPIRHPSTGPRSRTVIQADEAPRLAESRMGPKTEIRGGFLRRLLSKVGLG